MAELSQSWSRQVRIQTGKLFIIIYGVFVPGWE